MPTSLLCLGLSSGLHKLPHAEFSQQPYEAGAVLSLVAQTLKNLPAMREA